MDVVSEANGALDLDTVSEVNVGNRERLVTIVNRLNRSTTVTVSVTSGPGTLYTSGDSGSSVSFSLQQAASNTVDIEAGGTGGDQITYQIEAAGTGLTAVATRTVDTLSTGQAAPGYPTAFNDATGDEPEPNENESIPPGTNTQGDLSSFASMQQANDGGATAALEGDPINLGVVTRDPPDVSNYELQVRYSIADWSNVQPTVNIVDESGTVLQSQTLPLTSGQMNRFTFSLNNAADNFVSSNDVLYVTYTSSGSTWSAFHVDYQRIQKDPPPPEAAYTTTCSSQSCTFDASASTGYSNPIVEYQWTFGDGTSTTSSNSVTSHTYGSNGTYNVKLTVVTSTGETDTESKLITVGQPQPTFVPPDVYDDVDWNGIGQNEDNAIPPSSPTQKLQNFQNLGARDGSTATLQGGPMNLGLATRGISGSASSYDLIVRYSLPDWESDTVQVVFVAADNSVLQTHTLATTGGSLTNETIAFNSATESYVRNNGDLYVRYTSTGWVDLPVDAHLVRVTP